MDSKANINGYIDYARVIPIASYMFTYPQNKLIDVQKIKL